MTFSMDNYNTKKSELEKKKQEAVKNFNFEGRDEAEAALLKLEQEKSEFEKLSSTEIPKHQEDQIVELGGDLKVTEEVDKEIEEVKENAEEKVNQLKGWQEQKNQLDKFKEWRELKEQMKELAITITAEEWEKANEYYRERNLNRRIWSEEQLSNMITPEGGGSILSREESFARSRSERDLMLQKLKEGELYYSDITDTDPFVLLFLIKKMRGEFSPDAFISEDPFFRKKLNLG